jgi:hypothetical protein
MVIPLLYWNQDASSSSSDEDDIVGAVAITSFVAASIVTTSTTNLIATDRGSIYDHRTRPRKSRREFDHTGAIQCIHRDYLGSNPLFGKEFSLMFRLSKRRFELLMHDIQAQGIAFYTTEIDRHGKPASSFESRLLLPLKTLAYGVPPHAFIDYFQMSKEFARECCLQFDSAIRTCYMKEFLRLPTKDDLKAICALHKSVHKVDGLAPGSLDCTHTYWKNCPKAWQGSYQGKEGKPSIVLEAIADYHMWFWHASYGYAGTLNDKNILNLSPFHESLLNGTFDELEKQAGVVPYRIGDETFNKLFILVDGIYPQYSRFVKGIKEPVTMEESSFTAWQEGARKDIERAFGHLKSVWHFSSFPIHLHCIKDIAARITTCLILHNMLVSDRVMGDPTEMYNPAAIVDIEEVTVQQPSDLHDVQNRFGNSSQTNDTTASNEHTIAVRNTIVTRKDRWLMLSNTGEHARLYAALLKMKGNNSRNDIRNN